MDGDEVKQGRRKSGSFSDGSKYPEKLNKGLDWDKIRADHKARLDEEVARGLDGVEHQIHKMGLTDAEAEKLALGEVLKPKTSTPKVSRYVRTRKPVNVDELVRLYTEENMKPKDIGLKVELGTETVIKYLKKRPGVWDPDKYRTSNLNHQSGPRWDRRKQKCQRGHDLNEEGATKPIYKKNGALSGRSCLKCQAILAMERQRTVILNKWRDGKDEDTFTAEQYLTYLLVSDHGLAGGEARKTVWDLNRNFPGLRLKEKRTKEGWLSSQHALFLFHLQDERTGTDG